MMPKMLYNNYQNYEGNYDRSHYFSNSIYIFYRTSNLYLQVFFGPQVDIPSYKKKAPNFRYIFAKNNSSFAHFCASCTFNSCFERSNDLFVVQILQIQDLSSFDAERKSSSSSLLQCSWQLYLVISHHLNRQYVACVRTHPLIFILLHILSSSIQLWAFPRIDIILL